MKSIRIRQLEGLSHLTAHVYDACATTGNSDYMTICPSNYINSGTESNAVLFGHTLSLQKE